MASSWLAIPVYIYTYMLYLFTFHTIGTHFFRTRDHKHNDHPIFLGPGLKLLMASSGAPALASMRQTAPWRQIFRSNTFGILFGHGCFVPYMKLGQVWDVWAQPHGEDLTATHGTPQGTESKLRVHGIGHLCEASQVGWSQGKGWCWIQVQPSLKHKKTSAFWSRFWVSWSLAQRHQWHFTYARARSRSALGLVLHFLPLGCHSSWAGVARL